MSPEILLGEKLAYMFLVYTLLEGCEKKVYLFFLSDQKNLVVTMVGLNFDNSI